MALGSPLLQRLHERIPRPRAQNYSRARKRRILRRVISYDDNAHRPRIDCPGHCTAQRHQPEQASLGLKDDERRGKRTARQARRARQRSRDRRAQAAPRAGGNCTIDDGPKKEEDWVRG